MTSLPATSVSSAVPFRSGARAAAPALFAATLFVSALLLFVVQPMFTKLVLPRLGGSSSVWSVAMVAFQAFLFIGYVYAHVLSRALSPRGAAFVHLAFLAAAASMLPLGLAPGFTVPPLSGVTLWLLALFAASIGLPFVALSASAPLLQDWFVATGHIQARNPYVLYAASNLGSFAALIAYPFVIEPFLTLSQQIALWSAGLALLAVLIAAAATFALQPTPVEAPAGRDACPTWPQRFIWVLLTAVPAGLSIAVTAYITTDIAAAPFLWIIPLALYLLTFVAVFRERSYVAHTTVLRVVPYVVAPLAVSMLGGSRAMLLCVVNIAAFFFIALACHGEAYRRRPAPGRLTEFYLWISFGGMIGGIFAGLVAPQVFNNIYEYPVLIIAALALMPGAFGSGAGTFLRQAGPILILAGIIAGLRFVVDVGLPDAAERPLQIIVAAIAIIIVLQARRPARHLALVILAFAVCGFWRAGSTTVETARSFFGVHQVIETADRTHRLLLHGATVHGAERIRAADGTPVTGRPAPISYYYEGGSYSELVSSVRARRGKLDQVAVVGLGTGSLACYRRDAERWTFFEIDPEVIRIARDPARFRFLAACAPDAPIVAGDARLTLTASPQRFDLIVLDAFTSDAIPVHLLTREAFAGYRTRLTPGGVIAVHVSNLHMELASVVAVVGAAEGFIAYMKRDDAAGGFRETYQANSEIVVLARDEADLTELASRRGWRRLDPSAHVAAWTDDYANVLAAIWRRKWGG